MYFAHGLAHIQGASVVASLLVYAIKLSYLVIIVDALLNDGLKISLKKNKSIIYIPLLLLTTGTIAAAFHNNFISLFYFLADFAGFAVLPFYILIMIKYFYKCKGGINEIIDLMRFNLIITAFYLFIYFFISGGQKISTPPDVQAVLSVVIATAILGIGSTGRIKLIASIIAVIIIIALAQLRMLIIVGVLTLLLSSFRMLIFKFNASSFVRLIMLLTFTSGFLVFFGGDLIGERINTLPLIGDESNLVEDGIGDDSTNQRSIEALQVFNQMNAKWTTYFFGTGFGALYENTLVLNDHYNNFQHHLHSSPVAIIFRLGVFALAVYFGIFLFAIKLMMSRADIKFVAGIMLFMQWLSSLMDLYIFWGFSFALAIAFSIYVNRSIKI